MSESDFWTRAAQESPAPDMTSGASGYWSPEQPELDPALFDGDGLKQDVRSKVVDTLLSYLREQGFQQMASWLHVWFSGSGISYQWAGDRGNGDLDVMLGVDYPQFLAYNPNYAGMNEDQFADYLNREMHAELWPQTAKTDINGKTFEVTYYLNPGTSTDIGNIHPYAAYDLTRDQWDVRPPTGDVLAHRDIPSAWYDAASQDAARVSVLTDRYRRLTNAMRFHKPHTAQWQNHATALALVFGQAHALLDEIHNGRRKAFSDTGKGYNDWANFRWQYAKRSGAIGALRGITKVSDDSRAKAEELLYGAPIAGSDEVTERASLIAQHRPGFPS